MAILLTIENLNKAYGTRIIFENADLAVQEKQKIGVIGRNGAGKSTLLRMIVGEEECDSGQITKHDIMSLGYLRQHDDCGIEETVQDYLERVTGRESWHCAKIAGRFEMKGEMLDQKVSALSGGYLMRVKLAMMLLTEPNLFLLDEPTNYLDVHTQLLLEKFLRSYNGAFIIVSHDREFLKRTCTETLDVENGKLFFYPRPIDEYLAYKEERLAFAKLYNKNIEREQKHLQTFVDRFRYKASKAKQAQSKIKAIERLEKIDISSPLANVRIDIPGVEAKKGCIVRCVDVVIGYPNKTVAQNINLEIDRGEHVGIIGDNGEGKTTFLKTLADALPVISGVVKWAPDTRIAYYAQHVASELSPTEKVWAYLRRTAARDINDEEVLRMAGNFLFRDHELEKDIAVLSGGERSRLCLAGLLLTKSNVILLDEPSNHLDFETVEALGRALENFVGTVFFVSHNRTFVNSLASVIIEVKGGMVKKYPGTYEDYVYALEQSVERGGEAESNGVKNIAVAMPTSSVPTKSSSPEDSDKVTKKKIKKIEDELAELEKLQQILFKKQQKNPAKFLPDDYKRLGEIGDEIKIKEEEWAQLHEGL